MSVGFFDFDYIDFFNHEDDSLVTNYEKVGGSENIYLAAAKTTGANIWINEDAFDRHGNILDMLSALHSHDQDLTDFWSEVERLYSWAGTQSTL